MTREQYGIKRLLRILLSVCMIIGLMPMIALPARAEDDPNTIGVLEDDKPRCGNGWAWDGDSTLTLYGAKIAAGSDSVFTYSGNIESSGEYLVITGGQSYLTINGGYISATGVVEKSRAVMNKGCLDIGSIGINADVTVAGGYLKVNDVAEYVTINILPCAGG